MNLGLCFEDVLLRPKYSEIESRKEINISNNLGQGIDLSLPILSSPMDTVTETSMALSMQKAGGLGVIHRYNTIDHQCSLVRKSLPDLYTVAAAVGTQGDYLERSQELINSGAEVICIDVAHGHHILVKKALQTLTRSLPSGIHIMAGNVATSKAFYDLSSWGAHSIKVGIGGGSICSTRIQTGHGMPTFQSILECKKASYKTGTKLIADGGVKNSGDIVKALASGADFVMLGSLLSGTEQSPGKVITTPSGKQKIYRGMASSEAQRDWKGSVSSQEGISTYVPYKGLVEDILYKLEVGIRSGFSYSGARNISELREKVEFIQQTSASAMESSTHILRR
jgi:IMP dehydrogenase